MIKVIEFSADQIRYASSFSLLVEPIFRKVLDWHQNIVVKGSFIDVYMCNSCKPIWRINFTDYPMFYALAQMLEGSRPIEDVSFILTIPDSIYR